MRQRLAALLLVPLLSIWLCGACATAGRQGPRPRSEPLGEAEKSSALPAQAVERLGRRDFMGLAFDLLRSELYREPTESDLLPLASVERPRVFVCVYDPWTRPSCAESGGPNLDLALRRCAAQLLRRDPRLGSRGARQRIKIDVAYEMTPAPFAGPVEPVSPAEVGLIGLWFQHGRQVAWTLPSEALEHRLYSADPERPGHVLQRILELMRQRNPEFHAQQFEAVRFRSVAWVEGDPHAGRPQILRLYRAHPYDFDEVSESVLLQRIVWAADYLLSSISEEGRIRYLYDVARDRERDRYNLLRHAGTVYSLLQVYERTRYEPYRRAAVQGIEYLLRHCVGDTRWGPYGGGEGLWIEEGRRIKLGGPGLALNALVQYAEATGDDRRYAEQARGFARFIVSQQRESGEFVSFASIDPAGPPGDRVSEYYPGEAILGLVRFHGIDPDPLWLAVAVRGADWLIDVRDAGKSAAELNNDHWLMIALSYLFRETADPRYVEHSLALARAVRHQYDLNLPRSRSYPDYRGGYYEPPRSTPAATRGEGLVAVLDTCRLAGRECAEIEELLHETVRHEMLSQLTPETMWWPRNPAKAFGGWTGGVTDVGIRNDYVQHNMSSLLGAERQLARRRGGDRPGGPRAMPGGSTGDLEPAPTDDELRRLRAASLRYRGRTLWEREE